MEVSAIQNEIGITIKDYSFMENYLDSPEWFMEMNEHTVYHKQRGILEVPLSFLEDDIKESLVDGKNWEDWVHDSTEAEYWHYLEREIFLEFGRELAYEDLSI